MASIWDMITIAPLSVRRAFKGIGLSEEVISLQWFLALADGGACVLHRGGVLPGRVWLDLNYTNRYTFCSETGALLDYITIERVEDIDPLNPMGKIRFDLELRKDSYHPSGFLGLVGRLVPGNLPVFIAGTMWNGDQTTFVGGYDSAGLDILNPEELCAKPVQDEAARSLFID